MRMRVIFILGSAASAYWAPASVAPARDLRRSRRFIRYVYIRFLVRHGINDVVNAQAVGESGHGFGVFGEVGMLPGVADVHIEIDGDYDASLCVADALPLGRTGRRLHPETA